MSKLSQVSATAVSVVLGGISLLHALTLPSALAADRPAEKIVAELCVNCHGASLTGIPAPNLLDYFWNHGGRDEDILRSIRGGWAETGMPAFGGILTEGEISGLLAHIKFLTAEYRAGRVVIPAPPDQLAVLSNKQAFRLETFVSNLDTPWGIAFLPDNKILVSERPGRLRLIVDGKLDPTPIGGLPAIYVRQDGGLLDVAAHPEYAKNGWVYIAFTETGEAPLSSMTVVQRGKIVSGQWTEAQTLFRAEQKHYVPKDTSHYGSRFLFDGSGHLFFTIGDRGRPEDAQDLGSPLGKIHRIMDDGRIPGDNPFVNRPGALGSIWSYGHRHPQGLSFHPQTGRLWATEHGPTGGDELNIIEAGHNYGWPVVSAGTDAVRKFEASRPGMDSPVVFWTPTLAPSGIKFYAGDRFPNWKNSLFVCGLAGQQLRRIETEGDRVVVQEVLFKEMGRVRHMVTGPDGLIYLALNAPDRLARVVPIADSDSTRSAQDGRAAVVRSEFGRTADGKQADLFTLTNRHGLVAKVTNYGATLTELSVPDRQGKLGNVVREIQASAQGFENGFSESGAVFGRVANRIAKGRFVLGGREYKLAINNAPNHLHGGLKNFSRVLWTATPSAVPQEASVTFVYESPDGEEGYPGKLTTTVKYTLTEQDSLRIDYSAVSDQTTPVNLTNHAYFNLDGGGDVLDSELTLNADRYTVVDSTLIPTGEIREVAGSKLDFRKGAPLGARASELDAGRRYDHNFVLNRPQGDKSLAFAARMVEPRSGRMMEVWTTEPGVQLYTSPLGDQPNPQKRGFFCLETQHFPDSVNRPEFPSTLVRPGEMFGSTTEFRFSAK